MAARATRPTVPELLRAGAEKLTDKQWARFEKALAANEEAHLEVWIAWSCAQQLRPAYRHPDPSEGRKIATKTLDSFSTCPVPEIARLGRTLKRWSEAFPAYFDTGRSNNGGELRPSTASSNSTDASPEGFATTTTTACGCSSSAADYATPTSSKKSPQTVGQVNVTYPCSRPMPELASPLGEGGADS